MRLRNSQSDANATSTGDAPVAKPRRDGRGLGPFSGGQLTIVIVTLALVIGFPVAAFSVTGSATNIVDPVTAANKAKVDAKGNLNNAIHDTTSGVPAKVDAKNNLYTSMRDATTGAAARIDSGGYLRVNPVVSTPLSTFQITPGSSYSLVQTGGWIVTSIHVDIYGRTGAGAVQFALSGGSGCSSILGTIDAVDPAGLGVTTLDYGSGGLLIPGGFSLCVRNTSPGTITAAVFVFDRLFT